MSYSISYIYQIIDKFSPVLKRIIAANRQFRTGMGTTQKALKGFGEKAGNVSNALAGIGAGAAMAMVSSKAMAFEDVMTDVEKVVTFTSKDAFENFRESILKTSTELGKMPADLAQIAVAGGKLGVLPQDLEEFMMVVARTSTAFDMLEADAGEKIGSIKSKMGLTVKETENLMDAVNYLADNTAASGSRMIEIIARTSGTFKSIKMPDKFIAGWAALADQSEVTAELAASGMKMMINRMSAMPGMMAEMIKNPNEAITGMLKKFASMDDVSRKLKVNEMFGPEAGRFVTQLVNNMGLLDKTLGFVAEDTDFAGSMMKELEKKLKTGSTAWAKMKATWDIIGITIGDVLLPYIKELAPHVIKAGLEFRAWAKAHPQIIKIGLAIAGILAVVGPVVVTLGILASAISVLMSPIGAVILAFIAVGAAVFQVLKNWDYLVMDFKAGIEWIKKMLPDTSAIIAELFDIGAFNFAINALMKPWQILLDGFYLARDVWSEIIDKIKTVTSFTAGIGGKIANFFGFGAEENINGNQGIAATNTINSKNNLDGLIVVAPEKGAEVKSARMNTSLPGNLGVNIAGAY